MSRVLFHRVSAILWIFVGVLSFVMGWQDAVPLIWVASVYANVKSDWGAAEAADDRRVIERLDRIEEQLNKH